MSDKNTLEWLVAKVADLEKQVKSSKDENLTVINSLLSNIETSLAELLAGVEKGSSAAAVEKLVAAIKGVKVTVSPTFNVPKAPTTPITVEAVLPKQEIVWPERKPGKWKISMKTHQGPREMIVEQME